MESITRATHERLAGVNVSVPICWETHITAFNSSGGTDISGGVARDICSGEQKLRGNTYLRYTAPVFLPRYSHYALLVSTCCAHDYYAKCFMFTCK